MHGAPPPVNGVPALLGNAFPALAGSDAGRAVAIYLADVGAAILTLAEGGTRG